MTQKMALRIRERLVSKILVEKNRIKMFCENEKKSNFPYYVVLSVYN